MNFSELPVIGPIFSLFDRWFSPPPEEPEDDEVPPDGEWFTTRLITARNAVVACSVCRNESTRGLSDFADQLDAIEELGTQKLECGIIGVARPMTAPNVVTRIQVPNGRGDVSFAWVGPLTDFLTEEEAGATIQELAEGSAAAVLRIIGNRLRTKSGACCRRQVYKRLLPNDNPKRTIRDAKRVTRVPNPNTK